MSYCYYSFCIRTNRIKFIDLKFDSVNKYKFLYGVLVDNRYQPPIYNDFYEDLVKSGSIQALKIEENEDVSISYDCNILDNKHKKPVIKVNIRIIKLSELGLEQKHRQRKTEIENNKFYTIVTPEIKFITIYGDKVNRIFDLLERGVAIRKIWNKDDFMDDKTSILVSQTSIKIMEELDYQMVDSKINTIYYL